MSEPALTNTSFVITAWRGDEKLWQVFWVVGIGLYILSRGAVVMLETSDATFGSYTLFVLFTMVVQVWWMVSVWRCARNTSLPLWVWLARFGVFASGVITLTNLSLLALSVQELLALM